MMWSLQKIRWVICFVVIALSILGLLSRYHPIQSIEGRFFRDAADMDVYEYHFLAVNLYAEGKFPVIGFLRPEPYYHLPADDPRDIPRGELFRDVFRQAGPVTFTKAPPLYPILIALIYRIWGYDMTYPLILNFWLIALIAATLVTWAWASFGWRGLLAASVGMALFYRYSPYSLYVALPDLLLVLLLLLFFICFIAAERTQSVARYFVAGVLFILACQTKGYLMPVWGLLLVVFIYYRKLIWRPYYKFAFFTAGILILLLPWMIYINSVSHSAHAERQKWKQTLLKKYPISAAWDTVMDLLADKNSETEGFKMWTSQFYSEYMDDPAFIINTNQYMPNRILKYHNEFCADGYIHPEFSLIRKSFYYTLPADMPPYEKIYRFYRAHPDMIFTIALAKLRLGFFAPGFPVVLLAAVLQALALFFASPVRHKWWIILSCLLILLVCLFAAYYENVFLIATLLLSVYALFFMPKKRLEMDFILFQSFIITLFAITAVFHGNRPYIAVIEPLGWVIFFKSIYRLYTGIIMPPKAYIV